ncbi:MAG TPA: restriction endonuclease subunit S [Acidimicrobiales bacterium]|nr:restriction endonuclease subunit S [Acidimicrobiales bacterium]
MTEWRSLAMRDLMVEFHDGPHATPSPADAGPVYLGIKNITEAGLLELSDTRHIAEEDFAKWTRRVTPQPGDVVFTYEATLHRYAIIPTGFRGCLGRRLALIRPDEDVVLPRFLHFLMLGPAWRETVTSRIISGSTVDRIPIIDFPDFPISVPDLPTQRAVVEMLGSIDDLIENNRRRIELLEQMAQAIYREWFVRLHYPGHEDAALVDSALGPIPEGWAVKTIGEISINHDRLRKPLAGAIRAQRTGSFPYYGAAKLIDWIDGWIFDGEFLLFAEDGTVQTSDGFPVLQLVEGRFWANNHTHILQGKGVSTRFLFLASAFQPIAGFVTGAAQPKITQANLNRLSLAIGPTPIMGAFDEAINPIFDEWNLLKAGIAPLAGIRDRLLPKLVTGQIDVSNLDLDLDAAVESVA